MNVHFEESNPPPAHYARLFATTGWNAEYGFTDVELSQAIAQSWFAVSVWAGPELVGYGRVIADGIHHALIADLIVHPDWQGRGIGRAVLERLVDHCRAARIRDIQLFCARGKADFYRRAGFRERPADAPGMELPSAGGAAGTPSPGPPPPDEPAPGRPT